MLTSDHDDEDDDIIIIISLFGRLAKALQKRPILKTGQWYGVSADGGGWLKGHLMREQYAKSTEWGTRWLCMEARYKYRYKYIYIHNYSYKYK